MFSKLEFFIALRYLKSKNKEKFISIGSMIGVSLLSMMKLPSMRMLEFKGLFPTMDQARIISTTTFASRMAVADDKNELNKFIDTNRLNIAEDNDGALVFLARNAWHLNKAQEDFPKIKFSKIKE